MRTGDQNDVAELKGSKHRVLFQNGEGDINMGVCFNDPDIEWSDIYWYNTLAAEMMQTAVYEKMSDNKLISFDEKLKAYSCCVELHRKGEIIIYFKCSTY